MTNRTLCGRIAAMLAVIALLTISALGQAQSPGRHTVTGMVMKVDPGSRTLVVSHDPVRGLMPGMTMPFAVRNARDLQGLAPGMTVTFTLVLDQDSAHAERITVVRYESVERDPLTARRLALLQRLNAGPGMAMLKAGERVPDFTLTDQTRRQVSLSQFRGKVVVLNFIYTSCALPQFCFRVANHFAVVQKRFNEEAGRDLILLTVTFDPARDTPERLAEYASQWDADPGLWHFLTGTSGAVQRVCAMFGVDFFPDEGLMNHSVHTAVIDRRGVLVANVEGNQYSAAQLGDLVGTVLSRR